jgi:hypothetical protein
MDLGILGTEATGPEFDTLRLTLEVRIVAGKIFIDWGWGGYSTYLDMIQLQVDRGQGWVDLAYDTTPGYTAGQTHEMSN